MIYSLNMEGTFIIKRNMFMKLQNLTPNFHTNRVVLLQFLCCDCYFRFLWKIANYSILQHKIIDKWNGNMQIFLNKIKNKTNKKKKKIEKFKVFRESHKRLINISTKAQIGIISYHLTIYCKRIKYCVTLFV